MHLMPLPAERYEMREWRSAKVAPDYHVTVDYMHYSVDHSLIGEQVDVKLTSSSVAVMHGGGGGRRAPEASRPQGAGI